MRGYFINLAARTDRRAAMEQRLAALGLDAERVEALLFQELPPDLRSRYVPQTSGVRLSQREFSNAVSHQQAYSRFLATDARYGLILEDDAILSPLLPPFLRALENRQETIDLLRLETFSSPQQISTRARETIGEYTLHTMHGWSWGAAAYVISRDAAKRFIEHPKTLKGVIDRVIYRPNRTHIGPLIRRQLVPALAIQEDLLPGNVRGTDSDIHLDRQLTHGVPRSTRMLLAEFIAIEIGVSMPSSIHHRLGHSEKRIIPFRQE